MKVNPVVIKILRVEKEADEGGTLHAMANKTFVITSILVCHIYDLGMSHIDPGMSHMILLFHIWSWYVTYDAITMNEHEWKIFSIFSKSPKRSTESTVHNVGGTTYKALWKRQVSLLIHPHIHITSSSLLLNINIISPPQQDLSPTVYPFQIWTRFPSFLDMKDLPSISLLLSPKNFTSTSLSRLSTMARSQFGWRLFINDGDDNRRQWWN